MSKIASFKLLGECSRCLARFKAWHIGQRKVRVWMCRMVGEFIAPALYSMRREVAENGFYDPKSNSSFLSLQKSSSLNRGSMLEHCPECGKPYVVDISRHNLRNWLSWILSSWLFLMTALIAGAVSFSLIFIALVLGMIEGLCALGGTIQLLLKPGR